MKQIEEIQIVIKTIKNIMVKRLGITKDVWNYYYEETKKELGV